IESKDERPLLIVGNTGNAFGTGLKASYGAAEGIRFLGAIYDAPVINALRHYAHLYYHGHSVGGTNPSLLEAMGCGARIVAHRNVCNAAILEDDAYYFSDAAGLARVSTSAGPKEQDNGMLVRNRQKIRETYNWPAIVRAYEQTMLQAIAAHKAKR